MKSGFFRYHPLVSFSFFVFVIVFSMFFTHPVCLISSAVAGFCYSVKLSGKKAVKFNLLYLVPMMLIAAIINPAFNHQGITILTYLPSGNPLTLESILYGVSAAAMLFCVICWFSCYNVIMTSDKFIYLFGRIIPAMSLVLSMTLRFVPKFKAQIKRVSAAQRCVGKGVKEAKGFKKVKNAVRIMSVMITWSLENAIETADSMKSRGYGCGRRTAFGIFKFDCRDLKAFICIMACGIYVFAGLILGAAEYRYFPYLTGGRLTVYEISVYAVYAVLCFIPFIIEIWEDRKWNAIQLKI